MTHSAQDQGRSLAIARALALGLHDDAPIDAPSEASASLSEPLRVPHVEPEALIDRVRVALRLLGFEPARTQLEASPRGKVRGTVISGRFSHQSSLTRQCELRDQLERELGEEAMKRIGLFVTLTPAEAE